MSSPNGHVPDPAAEDRIVELLAAYDESLAKDGDTPLTPPLDSFEPEAIERIERVQVKLRQLRRLRDSVLDTYDATSVQGLTTELEPASNPSHDGRSPSERTDLPKTLGRFEIVRELGAGGSGVVLLAQDPVLNRLVALKIPRPEVLFLKDLRHRFIREAQAAEVPRYFRTVQLLILGKGSGPRDPSKVSRGRCSASPLWVPLDSPFFCAGFQDVFSFVRFRRQFAPTASNCSGVW
jgi:hypothetical protein